MINPELSNQYSTVVEMFKWTGLDLFDQQNVNNSPFLTIVRKIVFFIKVIVVAVCTWSHCAYIITSLQNDVSLIDLSLDICFTFVSFEGIIVYIVFCIRKPTIKSCVYKINDQWRDDVDLKPSLVHIKKKYLKTVFTFTSKYSMVLLCFTVIFLLLPLFQVFFVKFIMLDERVIYPNRFNFYLPYDMDKTYKFNVIFCLGDFFIGMNLTLVVNMGLLILTITMNNLRILFILLQDDFKTLFDAGDEFNEEEMKKVIKRHTCVLDLGSEVSKGFGDIFAVHLFFVSVTITFFGLSVRQQGVIENLQNMCGAFFVVMTIFYCCYFGHLYSDACVDVGTKVYESKWYNLKTKHKKIVPFILLRSQQISFIKSISLMEISLDIFKKVIQMAWSLHSLTITIYNEE